MILRTTDEFEAQPIGTVVRCDDHEGIGLNVAERRPEGWVFVGSSLEFPSSVLSYDEVEYVVLYAPGMRRPRPWNPDDALYHSPGQRAAETHDSEPPDD